MTTDIFDRIGGNYTDIFDRIKVDLENLLEKKIDLAPDVAEFIEKSVQAIVEKNVTQLMGGKFFSNMTDKTLSTAISRAAIETKNEVAKAEKKSISLIEDLKKQIDKLESELKKKTVELHNRINTSQERYQFGGFSPQFNDLNIGPPTVEGAWRIVKSGTDLQFQRLESNVWTLKGSFTP